MTGHTVENIGREPRVATTTRAAPLAMRSTKKCIAIAIAAAFAYFGSTRSSHADRKSNDPDPKRRVAVLEFRAGSAELPDIHVRFAALLASSTSLDVITPVDARRRYGDRLDRDLARCAGKARCVARIGRKLGAVEILLVGVSEFGDVILTLQRIRTRGSKVTGRIAEAFEAGTHPDAAAIRKYAERVMPKSDFLRFGTIIVQSNVDGAAVRVGKKMRGLTPIEPIRVPAPAAYEILVTKPGYVRFAAKVAVPPDGRVAVRTSLSKRVAPAWYKRWWAAAIAGTIIVAAATTAVLMTRDPPSSLPTNGTFFRF